MAEFVKYGVMHRNTFIHSPSLLDETYCMNKNSNIYFAGQITGVEGYVESISSGMVVALNIIKKYKNEEPLIFPEETMIGALAKYISTPNDKFQRIKDKKIKYAKLADIAIEKMKQIIQ